ncbi:hypothetical protein AB0399_34360, partial [Streptomyces sp. NPDC088194]|uniref:hypothetical protein n=1 Tax=Streptomyces sp. NPDC088194 TaxID=3154931 RepID=UPI00345023E3
VARARGPSDDDGEQPPQGRGELRAQPATGREAARSRKSDGGVPWGRGELRDQPATGREAARSRKSDGGVP